MVSGAFALLLQAAPLAEPPVAEWERAPSPEALSRFFPKAALQAGIGGDATFRCVVDERGIPHGCTIANEVPEGYGFGAAALKLSQYFRFRPHQVGGRPVEGGEVVVPIHFSPPNESSPDAAWQPATAALADAVTRPDWLSKPTAEDIARTYPRSAASEDLSGQATITCLVAAGGGLTGCAVSVEQPEGRGFGEAAIKLSERFRVRDLDADGRSTAGRPIRIPIRWLRPVESSAGPIKLKSERFRGTVEADCRYVGPRIDNCVMLRAEPYSPGLWDAVSGYAMQMNMPKQAARRGRIRLLFEVGSGS